MDAYQEKVGEPAKEAIPRSAQSEPDRIDIALSMMDRDNIIGEIETKLREICINQRSAANQRSLVAVALGSRDDRLNYLHDRLVHIEINKFGLGVSPQVIIPPRPSTNIELSKHLSDWIACELSTRSSVESTEPSQVQNPRPRSLFIMQYEISRTKWGNMDSKIFFSQLFEDGLKKFLPFQDFVLLLIILVDENTEHHNDSHLSSWKSELDDHLSADNFVCLRLSPPSRLLSEDIDGWASFLSSSEYRRQIPTHKLNKLKDMIPPGGASLRMIEAELKGLLS